MKYSLCAFAFVALANTSHAAISLAGPSGTGWVSLGANYDFLADQQTGDPASDIVGNAANPGFYTAFDDLGTPSLTDGNIGFRIRLDDHGGNSNNIAFGRNLWVGIDADLNGSVDVFLGVNLQGSGNHVRITSPGTGLNTSPNTTSVSSSPYKSFTLSASNYNYRAVAGTDGGGTINDTLDNTPSTAGDTDYYLSFLVPFNDVVAYLNTKSVPISINQNTALRYVLATSTQPNTFNQDLGGVNGGLSETRTWTEIGGFSPTISAGSQLVPEVSSSLLVLLGGMATVLRRRRR
ncbi:MAG: PEP-CTERM sorting domain-containing protein [Verrucomicrobiota bacterium]